MIWESFWALRESVLPVGADAEATQLDSWEEKKMNFGGCQRVPCLLLRGSELASHHSVLLRRIKCRSSTRRLAPRARLTSHPVRWNAVDRRHSFQRDWCTFGLIIEGWGSLFLPEWIHVWMENTTFFRNCFIRDKKASVSNMTVVCSARMCFVWEWRRVRHSQKRTETSGGFQTCEIDTVNFTAPTGHTGIFPRRL